MIAGHYAVGLAAYAVRPRPRVLPFATLASLAPDIPMLFLVTTGHEALAERVHEPVGIALLAVAIVALGLALRLDARSQLLALAALATHAPLDRLNGALFPRPVLDFSIEVGATVLAALLVRRRVGPTRGTTWLVAAVLLIATLQGIYDAAWNG